MPEKTICLTPELLHILQHSLGLDQYGEGEQYRNHFCAGGKDIEKCRALVGMGYMVESDPSELPGRWPFFHVTQEGEEAVAIQSPKPPKLSRSKRRYTLYLDGDFSESYGEWIKDSYYDDYRREHGV